MSITDSPSGRAKLIADTVEIERARLFGSALTLAETTSLTAALAVLDSVKLRLVRIANGREGWIG